jgi:hypothetical protein
LRAWESYTVGLAFGRRGVELSCADELGVCWSEHDGGGL